MKKSMFKTFSAKYQLHVSGVRKKFGRKNFGVQYKTKAGVKIVYFYDKGFRKDRTNIGKGEVDLIPSYTATRPEPALLHV